MGWSPTVFTAAGLAAAVVAVWLAIVGWRARSESYAEAFTSLIVTPCLGRGVRDPTRVRHDR